MPNDSHAVTQVNVHEAKTHLSRLLEQVEQGDEIIIARSGKPIAKLIKIEDQFGRRQGGQWRGKGWIAEDFDDPDPEIERMFYEGPIEPE